MRFIRQKGRLKQLACSFKTLGKKAFATFIHLDNIEVVNSVVEVTEPEHMVEVFESSEPRRIILALSLIHGEAHVAANVVEVLVPFLELALVRRQVAAHEKL